MKCNISVIKLSNELKTQQHNTNMTLKIILYRIKPLFMGDDAKYNKCALASARQSTVG